MPIYQSGQLNLAGQMAPGVYAQVVAPPAVVQGVATNGYGLVGVASWGPVNSAYVVGSPQTAGLMLGAVTNRKYDLATAVAIAFEAGQANNTAVRVTDGTDTAATAALKDGAGTTGTTLSGFYTGIVGNTLTGTMAAGTKPNTYKCTIALPGYMSEIFDNLAVGVIAGATTAGTGYTSVPLVTFSAPQASGGTQASGNATLVAASATVVAGGTDHDINDLLTLSNGVILKVTAATSGAITTASIYNAGSVGGGTVPTNPVSVISTTGSGMGATFALGWGLGPLNITNPGSGYSSATATLSGGVGTGGAYTVGVGCWSALVSAVNNGQSGLRGPSTHAIATLGTSVSSPALATTTFSGGTDGAAGVTDTTLVGTNSQPPTGMYALQNAGVLTMNLVDHSSFAQASSISAFCMLYGIFGGTQGSAGQSISTVSGLLNAAGVDAYSFKPLVGDWVYWQDTVNNVQRLLGPMTFWGPMRAKLAPNQSTLNKAITGLIGTQRSSQNLLYGGADALQATQSRLDYLANPSPGGNYFSFQTDMNASSFAGTNSEAYTTMTNFLALTLAANFGWVVGNPQTTDLRQEVNDAISAFLMGLWKNQKYIGDVNNPSKIPFSVQTNADNNPDNQVALGLMQTLVRVKYQAIVRVFAISLQGGSTVNVSIS